MLEATKKTVESYGMLSYGDKITIALSGGADSVAMLHILLDLRDEYGLDLDVCHINHNLRGEDADSDEQFVRRICDEHGLKCNVFSIDIAALSSYMKIGTEECGRIARYACFSKIGDKIATAHTASDNIETIFYNIARGTGLDGLCGIPPKREFSYTEEQGLLEKIVAEHDLLLSDNGEIFNTDSSLYKGELIRPLINWSRDEVERYLNVKGVEFTTDKSNFDTSYRRNLIRHEVVGVLKEINPSLENVISKMTISVTDDANLLNSMAQIAYNKAKTKSGGLKIKAIINEPPSIINRCIIILLSESGIKPSYDRVHMIRNMLSMDRAKLSVQRGYFAIVSDGEIRLTKGKKREDNPNFEIQLKLGEVEIPTGEKMVFKLIKSEDWEQFEKINKNLSFSYLDYDKITGTVAIRNRRNGDRIRLVGRGVTHRVKKLFSDIPIEKRDKRLIIADALGVVYLEGFGIAERVKPDSNTAHILAFYKENRQYNMGEYDE